jgi:biotin-dependent carboxylase-like uncharacterized protein
MAAIECFKILSPGLQTTVQDAGRFGSARFGIAPSGALDSFALRVANLLVGNPENEACLETLLVGLRMEALNDVLVSVTGAVLGPKVDQLPLVMWSAHVLKKGQFLGFSQPRSGCRSYIAVGGGIQVPSVLGSKSTNLPAKFGGFEGRMLKAGDILFSGPWPAGRSMQGYALEDTFIPTYPSKWCLRFMWGPQDEDFQRRARAVFTGTVYTVSTESDRSGIRLDGIPIAPKADTPESIVSEGVVSGAVQIPGDGRPIIVLGETVTGGYRKIATVISADLPLLGQIKPGDKVAFQPVNLAQARKAAMEMEAKIQHLKENLSDP